MRPGILLFWIFAVTGEIWTGQRPEHFQQSPAAGEEEPIWELEPSTQIAVTLKEEEADVVPRRKVKENEHVILNVAEEEERREQGLEERGDEEVDEENTTADGKQTQDRGEDQPKTLSADSPLTTIPPSQNFLSTIIPSLTTTTDSPADENPDIEEQNASILGTQSHFSALKNTLILSISENRTHEDSSLGQVEGSEKNAAPTTTEARVGPTAVSLPSTFKPKPKAKRPKIKGERMAKANHLQKEKKAKSAKSQKNAKHVKVLMQETDQLAAAPYFPYFKDHYCPPNCACYGRVVQCSDKGLENVPYGIPYNSRYILLMNNHIKSIPLDLLSEYLSMEFLVLSNNRLIDNAIEGAFEGTQALRRLYLDRNLLQGVPTDLPASLEELRLDGNSLKVISEAPWFCCPSLRILSLSNNSLESTSSSFPVGVLSPLRSLRTFGLSHNRLTSVPLQLPLSLQELYLRGNLIQRIQPGVFHGKAQLQVLDLSANRLTNKGLGKGALTNVTRLESLNLEGNFIKQVPRHLPRSLKTLNLEGNSISSISKATFLLLPHLEHLGLARNKISKVVPGAFRVLPLLHQLDLSHNVLHHVPRQLPDWLVYIVLSYNEIHMIPRDAFCSFKKSEVAKSRLVKAQLEHNLIDLANLDSMAFSCLRGFQVVHF